MRACISANCRRSTLSPRSCSSCSVTLNCSARRVSFSSPNSLCTVASRSLPLSLSRHAYSLNIQYHLLSLSAFDTACDRHICDANRQRQPHFGTRCAIGYQVIQGAPSLFRNKRLTIEGKVDTFKKC